MAYFFVYVFVTYDAPHQKVYLSTNLKPFRISFLLISISQSFVVLAFSHHFVLVLD